VSAHPAYRRGLLAAALARAEAWLLEPAEPLDEPTGQAPLRRRAVVAVFGLARGCGATTVARGLAAELAARDVEGAAAVASGVPAAGIPLASAAAGRLARKLRELPGARARALGRLCLVEAPDHLALVDTAPWHAPLVIDAGSNSIVDGPGSLADHVVVVAAPRIEPALASVAAGCLAAAVPEPLVVLNRAVADDRWAGRGALELPDSRVGAQLALSGREPRGQLGRAIAALADHCEEPR
jgi:hypothetical protein